MDWWEGHRRLARDIPASTFGCFLLGGNRARPWRGDDGSGRIERHACKAPPTNTDADGHSVSGGRTRTYGSAGFRLVDAQVCRRIQRIEPRPEQMATELGFLADER